MDNDRLQEIKRNVLGTVQIDEVEDIWKIAKELIAAVEEAQAELAEKQKLADDFMKLMHDHIDDGVQLRKQLAEAQAEVERGHFGIGHKP